MSAFYVILHQWVYEDNDPEPIQSYSSGPFTSREEALGQANSKQAAFDLKVAPGNFQEDYRLLEVPNGTHECKIPALSGVSCRECQKK